MNSTFKKKSFLNQIFNLRKKVTPKQESPAPNKNITYGSFRPSLSKIKCMTTYARISTKAEIVKDKYGLTPSSELFNPNP